MIESIIITGGAIVVRNILGWFENAFENHKIEPYEWKQLGAKVLRVGLIVAGLSYGLELSTLEAASAGVVVDMLLTKIGSIKK